MFNLKSSFKQTDDQKRATELLCSGIKSDLKNQVLLGVTGSGKTFTMANVIKNLKMPALIISHNKTLAGQLYQEMRDFFPENAVSYFVSYYDFYQPEAYLPATDTYIEKEAEINELIDKLRLAATTNILTRDDVVVVASVSCIYNIGSPVEYGKFILELSVGETYDVKQISRRLIELQYDRSEFDFKRGTFRIRGENIDIYPAYEEIGTRVTSNESLVTSISKIDPLTGKILEKDINKIIIYPAKHYMTDPVTFENAESAIRYDLEIEYKEFKKKGNLIEAQRLYKKVNYDLEMIKEVGYVNGIENYSRYFDGRAIGEPPFTLLDYFKHSFGQNFLTFIDESHMTVPQLRGMYNGDRSRKQTLIDYGFRLKAAIDNRPLKFDEFYDRVYKIVYVSATPSVWEVEKATEETRHKIQETNKSQFSNYKGIAEQLVRPTGIVDPQISVKPSKNEVPDLISEIEKRVKLKQRVLVTTLTKRIAEDLTTFLKKKGIRAEYLHSDIVTLERSAILTRLRRGEFDVLVGINLLREGLDLPEVVLVAILDAENEGFLRSKTALIQTMGRAARHIEGEIIIYADKITKSIKDAISEIERRREYQIAYNKKHNISPKSIEKEIKENILVDGIASSHPYTITKDTIEMLESISLDALTPFDKKKLILNLEKEMKKQARNLNFEVAIAMRDKIKEIQI